VFDGDMCDDCSSGYYDPLNDGDDNDGDGWCDIGDPYPGCAYDNANDSSVYPDEIYLNPYDDCENCHGDGFWEACVGTDDCDDMDCAGTCGQAAYLDDCDVCDDLQANDCTNHEIHLHAGANLMSFSALSGDSAVQELFGECINENMEGIIGENKSVVIIDGTWIGSLMEVEQDDAYWVILHDSCTLHLDEAISCSHDDDGEVNYDLHIGANLISYPHILSQNINDALGDGEDCMIGILGEGEAAIYMNGCV
jgi:hypothetical protein